MPNIKLKLDSTSLGSDEKHEWVDSDYGLILEGQFVLVERGPMVITHIQNTMGCSFYGPECVCVV